MAAAVGAERRDGGSCTGEGLDLNALDTVRRGYLLVFYLLQFLGFTWTFSRLNADLFLLGHDGVYSAFRSCAAVLYVCQMVAPLEVINAALGLIIAPVLPTVIQVMGRNLMLFVVFGSLREMQSKGVTFCVFYLWSSVEMFRCLFHLLEIWGREWRAMTWLWNAVWVLLYPLSTVAEAAAVLQALPIFDESRLFSVPLPERVGFSVSFSFSLRLYLILLLSGLFINMRHILRQRRRCVRIKLD
ncbi:very-long-chain (3R)-3-hydroxyacyl-CoA dehydratase-like [Hoplias malabaricus]|uniref:very-long-chain (3R)-3-hydroxyacyl-CoA dehydratase-like n=1 Tax=Hoplias malabaricus TaxID=27720 RepID=UPI00346329AC